MEDGTLKKSIVGGIVSTVLFVVLIQPMMRWGWGTFHPILTKVFSAYTDTIYRSAALGLRDWVDVVLITLLYAGMAGVFAASLFRVSLGPLKLSGFSEWLKKFPWLPKLLRTLLIVTSSLGIILSIALSSRAFADLQLNVSFRQRLTILAPHLSDQLEEELEAEWASMLGRSDYEDINAKLNRLAELNSIELLDPLLE